MEYWSTENCGLQIVDCRLKCQIFRQLEIRNLQSEIRDLIRIDKPAELCNTR
jgi:hypothetical protein